jgi:hypothetical protein
VPHRGIYLDDVVNMVMEEPQNQGYSLVEDVIYEAKIIRPNTEQFRELVNRTRMRIVSFYETGLTPKVVKVRVDGYLHFHGQMLLINRL